LEVKKIEFDSFRNRSGYVCSLKNDVVI